jgi:kinesin family protein 2/24
MQGIQGFVADDLFALILKNEEEKRAPINVYVSYFEIYGGRCQDLLNNRNRLNVREDGAGEVVVSDLMELAADSAESLHAIIDTGNRNRTTHATESNDESSRSHAICQIALKTPSHKAGADEVVIGRFSLIDLAGSERGADTKSHNRQRRMEGAEINKSLLALKECIRALDSNSTHVPYRAAKLTLVLKDSFTNKKSRTVMIATVSPAASSADHTLNTLRYADRIKERVVGGQAAKNAVAAQQQNHNDAKGVASSYQNEAKNVASQLPVPPRKSDPAPEKMPLRQQNNSVSDLKAPPPASSRATPPPASQKPPLSCNISNKINSNNNQINNQNNNNKDNYGAKRVPPVEDDEDDFLADINDGDEASAVDAFHRTVQDLFEEEEDLLNAHMAVIQENAELLTEEGRLLQQIQGENNDIDTYAARLDEILKRKQELLNSLKQRLDHFRKSLQKEESYSKQLSDKGVPGY